MPEKRNERVVFEGASQRSRGPDRRRTSRRKSDLVMTMLKYASVALAAALLVKYFG